MSGELRVAHTITPYRGSAGSWIHQQLLGLRPLPQLVLTESLEPEGLPAPFPCRAFPAIPGKTAAGRLLRHGYARMAGDRRFHRILRSERISVLHAHYGLQGWRALSWRRDLRIPLVISFYGYDLDCLYRHDPAWRRRYATLFQLGTLFLAEGPAMRGTLERMGCPPAKIRIHRLGIPTAEIPFHPPSPPGPGEPFRLLMAASLTEKKGHADALKALAKLPAGLARLTVVGNGPLEGELRRRTGLLGLQDRVDFLPGMPSDALHALMGRHHLFLHPSRTAGDGETEGGAPIVLMEALAYGLPAIATRHADIPEVMPDGEGGLLVPEGDPDDLAKAILALAGAPQRWPGMARAGRGRMERLHDRDRQGQALALLYQETCRTRSLCHLLAHGDLGGDPRVQRAMEAGRRAGYAVEALAPAHGETPPPRLLPADSPLRLLPQAGRQLLRDLADFSGRVGRGLRLAWRGRLTRADLYHAHDLDGLLAGALLARRHRAFLVYDAHEYPRDEVAGHTPWFRLGIGLLERLLVPRADASIAVSPFLAARMSRDLGIPLPQVVRNIPAFPSPPADAARAGFWYYGLLSAERGLENFLEALARVPEATGILQGYGPLETRLTARAGRPDLANRVVFARPSPPDLALAACPGDVGMVPLLPESTNNRGALPNKLFDYLHAGLPVLAADLPAIRETVGGWPGVFLCDFGSPADVARALRTLLDLEPSERLRLGRDNRVRAREAFRWEREAGILTGLYASLISPTPKTRKPAVLLLNEAPHALGGAENSLLILAQGLAAEGPPPLVTVPHEGEMAACLRAAGADVCILQIRPLTRTRNPLRLLLDLRNLATASCRLAGLARRTEARVIHANKTEISFHAALAGLLSGRPVVWHVRSYVSRFRLSGRLLALGCDRILCITDGLQTPFRTGMPWIAPRLRTIPNGVDTVRFAPRAEVPSRRIVTAGRLTRCKGFEDAIEAGRLLRVRGVTAPWGLYGDPGGTDPEGTSQDARTAEALRDLNRKAGAPLALHPSLPDLAPLLAERPVVVLPSPEDPFGRVMLEALASGCAVIAADAGCVREIARDGENCLLVPPRNPAAIAEAVLRLLGDPELRARLGAAGRKAALEGYGAPRHVADVLKVYRELLP